MVVFDVVPDALIKEIARDFKERIPKPEWTEWVKTGAHIERAPLNRDWFFERTASVLYRVYKDGPIGTGSLRTYYGGKKNRGVRPHRKKKSGGKILRTCLQTLEKEGLVKKIKTGRVITGKGESFLNKFAKEVKLKQAKTPIAKEQKKVEKEDDATKEVRETLRQQEKQEKIKEQKSESKEKK